MQVVTIKFIFKSYIQRLPGAAAAPRQLGAPSGRLFRLNLNPVLQCQRILTDRSVLFQQFDCFIGQFKIKLLQIGETQRTRKPAETPKQGFKTETVPVNSVRFASRTILHYANIKLPTELHVINETKVYILCECNGVCNYTKKKNVHTCNKHFSLKMAAWHCTVLRGTSSTRFVNVPSDVATVPWKDLRETELQTIFKMMKNYLQNFVGRNCKYKRFIVLF